MPLNALSPKPEVRACWNASSRFGPVTPVVPARLRVWQEPHLGDEGAVPVDHACRPVSYQLAMPEATSSQRRARCGAVTPSPVDAAGSYRSGGAAPPPPGAGPQGRAAPSRSALRGGDHGRGPRRPTNSARGSSATIASRVRPGAPAGRPASPTARRRAGHGVGRRRSKDSQRAAWPAPPRRACARPRQARVVRDDRQRTAGRRLRGDHPERLRERARDHHRLAGGQQLGELVVLEPPGEDDALGRAAPRRRGRRRRRSRGEERGR